MKRPLSILVLAGLALLLVFLAQRVARRPEAARAPAREDGAPAGPPAGEEARERSDPAPGELEPAGERGEPEARRPAVLATLAGLLQDGAGRPLAGAELSWTPFLSDQCRLSQRWLDLDHERIAGATLRATADANGRFRFEEAPSRASELSSVVWVSHPDVEACAVVFEAGGPWSFPAALGFVEGEGIDVRVVDPFGDPVPDAVVEQYLLFSHPYFDNEVPENLARRFFRREHALDEGGAARVAPAQGEVVLFARRGDQRSATWAGTAGGLEGPVELVLRDSFAMSGVLVARPGSSPALPAFGGGRVSIAFFDPDPDGGPASNWVVVEESIEVRGDGTFGPARWPLADREMLHVTIEGGDFVRVVDIRPAPVPGEHLELRYEVEAGVSAVVLAVDGDGAPIPEVYVGAWAVLDEEGEETVRITFEGWTGDDGRVHLRGLPRGQVSLDLHKEGYAAPSGLTGLYAVPPPEGEVIRIELLRAGRLSGVVLLEGEPVPSFEVVYWTEDQSIKNHQAFEDEEGRFVLEDVPAGSSLSLFAFAPSVPQSDVVSADVPADIPPDVPAEVEDDDEQPDVRIELDAPRTARGIVHDGRTGRPLAGARVQLVTSMQGKPFVLRDEVTRSDAEGVFEIPAAPGRGCCWVQAEGFVPTTGWVPEKDEPTIDMGIIVLHPASRVVARVRSWPGDPTELLIQTYKGRREAVPFGPDGTAVLEDLPLGVKLFHLLLPDGSERRREAKLTPGGTTHLDFDLSGEAELAVEVAGPGGVSGDVSGDASIRVTFPAGRGFEVLRRRVADPQPTRIRLSPGPATLELLDASGEILATRSVQLAAGTNEARVELGEAPRRIRLLDGKGAPIPAVKVLAAEPGRASGWYVERFSDARGEFLLPPLSARELALTAYLDTHEIDFGHRVRLAADPDEVTEVKIDVVARIQLRLLDGDRPAAGVHVDLSTPDVPYGGHYGYTSGTDGLVFGPRSTERTFDVDVVHAAYWPSSHQVPVSASADVHEIEVWSLGELELRAYDADGLPAPGVPIGLRHFGLQADVAAWIREGRVPPPPQGLATDGAGKLSLTGIPRGRYAWTAGTTGTTPSGHVEVPPRGRGNLDVHMPD